MVFAVDLDGFRRGGEIIGGGLSFFLRAVFGIGLDIVAQQFVEGHGQVFAGGDRAPAANGVHAHGDRAFGQQVGVFTALDLQFVDFRIAFADLLEVDFLFRGRAFFAHKVDGQVEEFAVRAVGQHVLEGADHVAGLQVAAAHAETTGVEHGGVAEFGVGGQQRVGQIAFAAGHAVFQALADGGADFTHQRQVFGQGLIGAFEHANPFAAFENRADEVAGEGAVHGHVDHADFQAAGGAQIIDNRFGGAHERTHAEDQVFGVVGFVAHDAGVFAAGQFGEFGHALVGEVADVFEEIGTLRGDGLHVGVLVLHAAGDDGVVHVPEQRHAAAFGAVHHALGGRGAVDHVLGMAEVFLDQRAFGHAQGFDQVGGEEAVLADRAGGEREFGDFAGDEVEVRRFLRAFAEDLEEARVVHQVIVVVARVHVEGGLGDGAAADVEDVGKAFADGAVERLVHVGDALAGGEIRGAKAGHGHAGGDPGGGVFAFRLDEDQRTSGDVDVAGAGHFRPVLAHLRGGGDGVGTRRVARFAFTHDDGGVAVHRFGNAGVFGGGFLFAHGVVLVVVESERMGRADLRMIFFAAAPLMTVFFSNQTMAPVGQRSVGSRLAR